MGLLENHSLNEKEYIEDAKKAERTQVIKEGEMESESSDVSRIYERSKTDNFVGFAFSVWRMLC